MWRNVDEEEQALEADCVFCKIVAGTLPSKQVFEDDYLLAFHDVTPVAKVHVLIIPKQHITLLEEATETDDPLLGRMLRTAAYVAEKMGVQQSGYRVAVNQGADAGQVMDHLHVHVMGGQNLYPLGQTTTGTEG